jgi:hypothetical protein
MESNENQGIFMIRHCNRRLFLSYLVFPIFFLYLSYNFFLNWIFEKSQNGISLFIITNLAVLLLLFLRFHFFKIPRYRSNLFNVSIKLSRNFFFYIGFFIIGYGIYTALPVAMEIGFFNRIVRNELVFFDSSSWLFLRVLFMVCFAVLIYKDNSLTPKLLLLVLLVAILDVGLLGGRRLIAAILLGMMYVFSCRLRKKDMLIIFLIFGLLFLFSGIREFIAHGRLFSEGNAFYLALASNEFQVVSYGIEYYANIADKQGYGLGASYFLLPEYIINYILSIENIAVGRGYGYFISHYSELMLNFGDFSFIFGMVILLTYFYFITSTYGVFQIILAMSIMDFVRTSFSEFLLLIVIFLTYLFLFKLIGVILNAFHTHSNKL